MAGEKERRAEGGGQLQLVVSATSANGSFSFGTSGSKPPVSGIKRSVTRNLVFPNMYVSPPSSLTLSVSSFW